MNSHELSFNKNSMSEFLSFAIPLYPMVMHHPIQIWICLSAFSTRWYPPSSFITPSIYTDWWFGTYVIFPYIGNFTIPTDFHIFQRGRYGIPQTSIVLESLTCTCHSAHRIHLVICTNLANLLNCVKEFHFWWLSNPLRWSN